MDDIHSRISKGIATGEDARTLYYALQEVKHSVNTFISAVNTAKYCDQCSEINDAISDFDDTTLLEYIKDYV